MNNLINNAIKFTPKNGEIQIILMLHKIEGETLTLKVSVIDTGIGVPLAHQNKIFSLFSQADESTTRKFGGTGLGLAICKQLVECMGGTIKVQSEEGKGSAFIFSLCLGYEINHTEKMEHSPIFSPPKFSARILLVEDNPLNHIVVHDMLENLGCSLKIVESGQKAIEAVKTHPYDLILMDCHMPQMDGFTATKHIRVLEREQNLHHPRPRSTIIALTANTLKGTKERCLSSGMDDYLSKPVNYSQLSAMMTKYLPTLH